MYGKPPGVGLYGNKGPCEGELSMGPIPIKPIPQAFTYCKNRPGFYKTILVIPSGRWVSLEKNQKYDDKLFEK
jgi:hypothetical protein